MQHFHCSWLKRVLWYLNPWPYLGLTPYPVLCTEWAACWPMLMGTKWENQISRIIHNFTIRIIHNTKLHNYIIHNYIISSIILNVPNITDRRKWVSATAYYARTGRPVRYTNITFTYCRIYVLELGCT